MIIRRVLFLVNGLGLGNSTRCHAIIERLLDDDVEIQIVTSGNGLWYFNSIPRIAVLHEIESLYYGVRDGRISVARTLRAAGDFAVILRRNARKVAAILSTWRPDVVVSDSVYNFRPFKRRHIPFVALNNADVVHAAYRRYRDRPRSVRAQFWCVEECDYIFHRLVPDLVISPSLDPTLDQVGGNVRRVGPIVRRGFPKIAARMPVGRVVVMLSGSRFGSPVMFRRKEWPFEIDVVGRPAPNDWDRDGPIRFHGKLFENKALVGAADLVVVNGGFSAISESFSLRKPLVVIPVANHAEQWVNARTIEHLGVGVHAPESELEDALRAAAEQVERFHTAYGRIAEIPDGAAEAAELITSLAGSHGVPTA